MSSKVVNITDDITVDVELLRGQRNTLLDILEVLVNSPVHDVEDFFGLDHADAAEKVEGVISLLEGLLDTAEGFDFILRQ
jgi:hypothetical protein